MKDKIFQKLKQGYSHLGLGDDVLQVQADALNGMGLVNEENIDAVILAQKPFLEKMQREYDRRAAEASAKGKAAAKKEMEDELLQKEKEGNTPDWYVKEKAAMDAVIKDLVSGNEKVQKAYSDIKKEYDALKLEKAASERKNFITSKAKELGIPQYRIDEGFVIAESADEEAITSYLTGVANNIKAMQLPADNVLFPKADGAVEKADTDAIAKSLVR